MDDIFTRTMERDNCTFPEAVEHLAKGIDWLKPTEMTPKIGAQLSRAKMREDHEDLKSLPFNADERWLGKQAQATLQPQPKDQTDALIQERKGTHGDWKVQSSIEQQLKNLIVHKANEHNLELADHQWAALEMICVKISRILAGDANHADHWDDIAGYARLGKQGHSK